MIKYLPSFIALLWGMLFGRLYKLHIISGWGLVFSMLFAIACALAFAIFKTKYPPIDPS